MINNSSLNNTAVAPFSQRNSSPKKENLYVVSNRSNFFSKSQEEKVFSLQYGGCSLQAVTMNHVCSFQVESE